MQCCNSAIISWPIRSPLFYEHWLLDWRLNRWWGGIDNGSWYKGCGFEPRRGKWNKLLMFNLQKERDGLSWDGLTWVGKMVRDDSGTGWKRDGFLNKIQVNLLHHIFIFLTHLLEGHFVKTARDLSSVSESGRNQKCNNRAKHHESDAITKS